MAPRSNSSFTWSATRRVMVLSVRLVTVPNIPLVVTTLSPRLIADSIRSRSCFCFCWGRIMRKEKMANIAPNITSVGISCEPPPPAPPGEGAIAHATSGKKGFIGPSGYPIVREKPSPEGVERAADDRLAHRRHEAKVEANLVTREQPVR